MDLAGIQQLFGVAQEGPTLEFKAGAALGTSSAQRSELVKDVSGMANAAGGRLIYGIAEAQRDGVTVATGFDPITDPRFTSEWITQVVTSNTGPPLSLFKCVEIAVPDPLGRVIVLDIQQASTAHQSHLDQRYYQRAGSTVVPMLDFQIRDVMGRRTAPVLEIRLVRRDLMPKTAAVHRYGFHFRFANVGSVTLENWHLEYSVPSEAYASTLMLDQVMTLHDGHHQIDGLPFERFGLSSRVHRNGPAFDLHPGQLISFNQSIGLPEVRLEVHEGNYPRLSAVSPPIHWRLFVPNAQPITGKMPFDEWCSF